MVIEGEERVATRVWDWQTRVLHWINAFLIISLALLMVAKEVLEDMGLDEEALEPIGELHAYVGYVFIAMLVLRITWGFFGNKYARWSDIIPYTRERWRGIAANLKWYATGFRGKPARAAGHDPLASLFYCALFAVLVAQAASGLTLAGAEYDLFPGRLIANTAEAHASEDEETEEHEAAEAYKTHEAEEEGIEEVMEEVHEFGFYFILFFLAAHMIGLVAHEVKEKNGVFSSMISGVKYLPGEEGE